MSAAAPGTIPWRDQLARSLQVAEELPEPPVEGQLSRMIGLTLEAQGCQAAVGDSCEVMPTARRCTPKSWASREIACI
jgi:flagellum-specific ATP synthase